MKVISFNMNGIRAAHRKGFYPWVHAEQPDYICVQETKAQMDDALKAQLHLDGYEGYFADAQKKGYSGVGIFTKQTPLAVRSTIGHDVMDAEGRFIELTFPSFKLVSLYLPSGTSGDARQSIKMEMLDWFHAHYLEPLIHDDTPRIICGDWNIAHTQHDLKNWRQNQTHSGFLPEERAWLDQVFHQTGWLDVYRQLSPEQTEYTWWSYRGQARQNNTGWRIDYQVASSHWRDALLSASVAKDPVFSDHAPLIACYALDRLQKRLNQSG